MIVVTGAAGFIGSNLLADLEDRGEGPLVACDWFGTDHRWRNLAKRRIDAFVSPELLGEFLDRNVSDITTVIHMGAISSTTERDVDKLVRLNIQSTVTLWDWCAKHGVPFLYASSAAVYGGIETGFIDDESPDALAALRPLNAYGWSKKAADEIILTRVASGAPKPPQWIGLRFFNVYGPNEYHKGDMRSIVAKLFRIARDRGEVNLFRSGRPDIADGQQRRDFVYVKDCTRAVMWLMNHPGVSGIFNLGTGTARTFADVVDSMGLTLKRRVAIHYVEMPKPLRDGYQYFTEADMSKLRRFGYDCDFSSLEDGVGDYVRSYLDGTDYYR